RTGNYTQELNLRGHRWRERDAHLNRSALTGHRPSAAKRVLHPGEGCRQRARAEVPTNALEVRAAALLRYVEKQIFGRYVVRKLVVPAIDEVRHGVARGDECR